MKQKFQNISAPKYKQLTEHEIQTQWFLLPAYCAVFTYGHDATKQFMDRREELEKTDMDYLVVAWRNGTSILFEHPKEEEELNTLNLSYEYHSHHALVELFFSDDVCSELSPC